MNFIQQKQVNDISKKNLISALICISFILSVCFLPQIQNIYALPLNMRFIEGENFNFETQFPLTVNIKEINNQHDQNKDFMPIVASQEVSKLVEKNEITPISQTTVEFKLLGVIPFKSIKVDVLPSMKLVPGGHSIGVMLQSQGIIVVGNSPVYTSDGKYVNPAKEAGILIGDVLLSVNGIPLKSDHQLAEIIDESGKNMIPVNILLKRNEGQENITVIPVLCKNTKRHRIGLFVRDSAAGVGTLTFYDPISHIYGALGHIITDNDTNQAIDCEQGKIVMATVSGIHYGRKGHPGEKLGVFIDEEKLVGNINKNTQFGIYGKITTAILPVNEKYSNGIPVASMSQVKLGKAKILTVVEGQMIEEFDIEIEKINLQAKPEGKGLVIKVTDEKLLEKTGGIVQGMSGSPIIQDGKIIGAVTHVFIHEPTLGYGCFMDWMLIDSGLVKPDENQENNLFSYNIKKPDKTGFSALNIRWVM